MRNDGKGDEQNIRRDVQGGTLDFDPQGRLQRTRSMRIGFCVPSVFDHQEQHPFHRGVQWSLFAALAGLDHGQWNAERACDAAYEDFYLSCVTQLGRLRLGKFGAEP